MRRPRTTKVFASRSVSTAGATSGSKDKKQPKISFGQTGVIDFGTGKGKKPTMKKPKR